MKIIIYDSNQSRWTETCTRRFDELEVASKAMFQESVEIILSGYQGKSFATTFNNSDLLLIHENDISTHFYNSAKMDLTNKNGPKIIKFSGGGTKEETGEDRERVFALLYPIASSIFTKAETWKAILKYISDPKAHSKPACMGGLTPHSRFLTSFVLLHLGLTMEGKEKGSFIKGLIDDDKKCLKAGQDFLSNQGKMGEALCEIMGVPHPGKEDCPKPLTQLQEWVRDNHSVLNHLFEWAVGGEQSKSPTKEKLNGALDVIEALSEIVDHAVDYGEQVKKNSVLRHFLNNAVSRLSGYPKTLDAERCRSLEQEMMKLDSLLASVMAPDSDEFWTDEIKDAAKGAHSIIGEARKALQQTQSRRYPFSQQSVLLGALDQVAGLTLSRVPMSEAK